MLVTDLIDALDEQIDLSRAADWDRVGLQVGSPHDPVVKAAVCHEVTPRVVDEVLTKGVTTLISYHPLLFVPSTSFVAGPTPEGRALALAQGRVSVIVVHTAFDAAAGGTAESLGRAVGLIGMFGFGCEEGDPRRCVGRVGSIDPRTLGAFAEGVAGRLDASVRVLGDTGSSIETVAVVPGSGGSFIEAAADMADVLVTGDVKHHEARRALDLGLAIIDAGHAGTERPGVEALYSALNTMIDDVSQVGGDPDPWKE